jgi:DNA polymerase elongation subunit (family B)
MVFDNLLSHDDNKVVSPLIIKYHRMGFRLVPVGDDSKTPNVASTNEIYNNPNYWTEEKLIEDCSKFSNIATTFGVTYTPEIDSTENKRVYLHCLDIDSDNVLAILFDLVKELKSKTFVTKTKKDCGYHIYWLSHTRHPSIGVNRCKQSYEFEIKSDNSLGLCTLPPSTHRNDPTFRYRSVGLDYRISIDDWLYDKLLGKLSGKCLKCHNSNVIKDNQKGSYLAGVDKTTKNESSSTAIFRSLDERALEQAVSALTTSYRRGHRNSIIFGLAGLLFKSGVSLQSAEYIVTKLCDYTNDEEKSSRLEVLTSTYLKGLNCEEIKGAAQLLDTFAALNEGGKNSARQILKDICQGLGPNKVTSDNDEHDALTPTTTQTLIQLANEETLLFFKDQYDIAYAKVKIQQHSEIIALATSRFEYFLSKLYFDYTRGEVAGQESLNNAIRMLISQTLFDGVTVPLHLRIAWGHDPQSKAQEIYYDLSDPLWRCIKITLQGWEIIQEAPVLFIRFNQKAQAEPDRNYPSNIFDKYLDLMHIKSSDQRLLIKVWTVAAFIPDIPHPISIPYGEKGSVKTTYCKFQKRLIDPDKIELLTVPQEKNEFVQQQYHNYLAVYDNIKTIPYWFSDEVCKAITGIGSSKRRLYTDDDDVIYSYKRLLIINGINNSLTEPDALDRSILKEFERIPDDKRKEESKVEAQFEETKPRLLGYIFDILVKSLQIKPTVQLHNLPRMADFALWGESIARAMGYKPMQFIETYYRNIGRQNVEVIESNPLAQAIEKFVYTWYKEGAEACWQSATSKALEQLSKVAQSCSIDTTNKLWPKAANSLTKRLRPILSNLREGLGIHVIITRNTVGKNKNTSTIRIWKEPPLSPLSPPCQNEAQNEEEIGGGNLDDGYTNSIQHRVSPLGNSINHAQKTESGGSGDGGDAIPSLEESHSNSNIGNEELLSKRCVAFDFEWSQEPPINIFAAAFIDNQGSSKVLHLTDFLGSDNPERDLLLSINQELMKYDFSIGWYSTGVAKYHEDTQEYLDGVDSDLAILHNRCVANDVDSMVNFSSTGVPYVRSHTHVDLHNIFSKPMIQTSIFRNSYRTLRLDEVSKVVLSEHDEELSAGKYKGLTGKEVQELSVEEQKKYVLRDAELVMQLSKHNNGEVLDAIKSISEITGLDFERVCKTGLSTWWAAIFDNMVYGSELIPPLSDRNEGKLSAVQYVGGIVIQPKKGLYHDLTVVDVTSLYPTMAILHNVSFDTVNCQCCKYDSRCRISRDITKDCKIEIDYWVCRQKEGAFPNRLKIFKGERLRQKRLGNRVKQLALKILINGGYGVFGSPYFKYYDARVAELITAYGRYTISNMRQIAENMGFEIVYGDTDSLFLHNNDKTGCLNKENLSKFKEECAKRLGVEVEHPRMYKKAIISDKKKHYVGWTNIEGSEPDIVGMEGDKNDRPKWINNVFKQTVYDILVHNTDPIPNLKQEVANLESGMVNPELLKRSNRLSKNPEEYQNENDRKRKIGIVIGARKGDIIEYFESDNKEGYSLNRQDISVKKYKIMLWKAIKEIMQIAGYDILSIEQELFQSNISHKVTPSRGVAGSMNSCMSYRAGANEVAKHDKTGGDL